MAPGGIEPPRVDSKPTPLYPLSYGALLACTVSCAGRVVAVAQLVEPRVVIPVVAGSSPVRHPCFECNIPASAGRYFFFFFFF